jgi:plastocyanin
MISRTRPRHLALGAIASFACLAFAAPAAAQADGNSRMSVTVAFGAGLNTAQPGNAANHHVLPNVIEVKAGGVVSFAVAGFHQITVYEDGVQAEDLAVPLSGLYVNDLTGVYYMGIVPAGGPMNTPATTNPSNAVNRVESVTFPEPGVYLVICNIRTHFTDGMYAYVRVSR